MRAVNLAIIILCALLSVSCSSVTYILLANHVENRVDQSPIGKIVDAETKPQFVSSATVDPQLVDRTIRALHSIVTSTTYRSMSSRVLQVIIDPTLHVLTLRLSNCQYLVIRDTPTSGTNSSTYGEIHTIEGNFLVEERGVWQPCTA